MISLLLQYEAGDLLSAGGMIKLSHSMSKEMLSHMPPLIASGEIKKVISMSMMDYQALIGFDFSCCSRSEAKVILATKIGCCRSSSWR